MEVAHAGLVGTHRNSLHRVPDGPQLQKRLGMVVKILMTVTGMMADPDSDAAQGQAVIWFRHQPISAFGGSTAAELVQAGHAEALLEHLHAMHDGGYA